MLSEVPEGWRPTKLGDITDIKTGGTPSRKEDSFWGGEIYWMSSGEVWKKRVFDTKEKITEAALSRSAAKMLPKGSVMIALNGQGKTRGAAAILERDMTCNQSLAAVVPSEKHDNYFMLYFIESQYQNLRNITGDNARNGLNLGLLKSYELVLPPINEQQRIGEILSSVDASIQATQAVIEQAERVKRGLMEQLLTGGLGSEAIARGDVPEGWQSDELKECLCKIIDYRGKAPPKAAIGIPLITAKNIRKGFLSFAVDEYIDAEQYNDWMTKGIPQAGDVMFTTEAPLGNVALFPSEGLYALGQRVITLRCNERLESSFLFYLLQSKFMEAEIQLRSTGSTAKGIKSKEFQKIKVPIPTIEEQLRTARILASFDASITEQKRILQQYAQTKRGLMDDLLTGKVRTV